MGADYIPVGELAAGFSEHILPATDSLVGKKRELHYQSGKRATITFISAEGLLRETTDEAYKEKLECRYRAIMPRDEIYFVDFLAPRVSGESVSVILEVTRGIATVVTGILPTPVELMIPLIVRA